MAVNSILRRLPQLSDDELDQLTDAVHRELETRAAPRVRRGFQRSTYMVDRVRGRRLPPRYRKAA